MDNQRNIRKVKETKPKLKIIIIVLAVIIFVLAIALILNGCVIGSPCPS